MAGATNMCPSDGNVSLVVKNDNDRDIGREVRHAVAGADAARGRAGGAVGAHERCDRALARARVGNFEDVDSDDPAGFLAYRCGVTRREASEYLRVAEALRELPAMRAAFSRGELTFTKVRALTRVATASSEVGLIELAGSASSSGGVRSELPRQPTATQVPDRPLTPNMPPRPPPGSLEELLAENHRSGLAIGPRTNRHGGDSPFDLRAAVSVVSSALGVN